MSGYDIDGRARALHRQETVGRAPAGFAHYYPAWELLSEVERSRYRERVITPPESIPWSQPGADPLRDVYEVGEASRKSWPFI